MSNSKYMELKYCLPEAKLQTGGATSAPPVSGISLINPSYAAATPAVRQQEESAPAAPAPQQEESAPAAPATQQEESAPAARPATRPAATGIYRRRLSSLLDIASPSHLQAADPSNLAAPAVSGISLINPTI